MTDTNNPATPPPAPAPEPWNHPWPQHKFRNVSADAPAAPSTPVADLQHRLPRTPEGQMARTLLAAGVEPSKVEAAAAADGLTFGAADGLTPAQRAYDASFGINDDPARYQLHGLLPYDPANGAAFDADVRQFLAGARWHTGLARSFVAAVLDEQKYFAALPPAAQQTRIAEQRQAIRQHFGDNFDAALAGLDALVADASGDRGATAFAKMVAAAASRNVGIFRLLHAQRENLSRWWANRPQG